MEILAFADLHGHGKGAIEKAKDSGWFDEADRIVLLGDIPQNEIRIICDAADSVGLSADDSILGILGNHDWYDTYEPFPVVRLDNEELRGHQLLNGIYTTSTGRIDALDWLGMSGSPRYKSGNYAMFTQEEASEILDKAPEADILITHDGGWHWFEEDDAHCGFRAIDEYIERCHPRWHIFGHQHVTTDFCHKSFMSKAETHCVCVYGAALIDLNSHEVDFYDLCQDSRQYYHDTML